MFEVGFTEIVLILGLALLVLGPEKLPALAEKIGRWTGRARSMARQLRTQLEHEVTLEELSKSKPMQAPREADVGVEPAAATASPTPENEPAPPSGFDLDQHLAEIDTSPEAMHRNDPPVTASVTASADTFDSDPHASQPATSPEAMHEHLKNKAES
jgi:sec-independent protein translocase protein TatB